MKLSITILFFLLLSFEGVTQQVQNVGNNKADGVLSHKNITLIVSLTGLSKNEQGALKDEILTYNEKIIALSLNEDSEILTVTHTRHFSKNEMLIILNKYGVDKPAIVSY